MPLNLNRADAGFKLLPVDGLSPASLQEGEESGPSGTRTIRSYAKSNRRRERHRELIISTDSLILTMIAPHLLK